MAVSTGAVSMRELLEAGVHFGHQTRRWNPKMRRFIFAERGGIYIIDLTQTSERLDEAQQFLRNVAERGGTVLFVGTKKQAQDAVENEGREPSYRIRRRPMRPPQLCSCPTSYRIAITSTSPLRRKMSTPTVSA